MCGITGIVHLAEPAPVFPERLGRMTDSIAHRGPDGSGHWFAPGIGLGHRRLSIIDLAGSAQPMASEDEAQVLSYNGEIYNFRELRSELVELGHKFVTQGDTEVLLAAWRQWGPDCLQRLNGMFAFALYDQPTRSLFLARDRLGVKPLYFAPLRDGSVSFASELKALLADPVLQRQPDLNAVDDFLAFGYVPDHACIVAGVKKLAAGHYLHLQQGKPIPASICYWDVDFSGRSTASEAELQEELDELLGRAVAARMVSDVPLGAFLSGGVDSSTVVAKMAAISGDAVRTCTIGFDNAALNESEYAARIAKMFGTSHQQRIVSPNDFSLIDTLADQFDEPFADASALPTYRVCELARESVTVALSGDGADEAFAGYRRQAFHLREEHLRAVLPAAVRTPVFGALGAIYPKADWAPRPLRAKASLLALAKDGAAAYADAVGVTGHGQRHAFYSDKMRSTLGSYRAEDAMITLMHDAPARDGLDSAQYADLKMWLPGDILTKTDRMSMAVSLEAREPLLDYRLVEFASRLPTNLRIRGGTGKYLLKKTMEKDLPRDILYRPKMGFVTPIAQWFRKELAGTARDIAEGGALARSGWFEPERLKSIADAHIAGHTDNSRLLWQLLMLDKSLARIFSL